MDVKDILYQQFLEHLYLCVCFIFTGYKSVELNPIAAVSVQLLCNGIDVQISGPVQITLPLAESSQSQLSYSVPAWTFDRTIGRFRTYSITDCNLYLP